MAATRSVERNQVRAGMVKDPGAYPWSSAGAHLSGRGNDRGKVKPLLARVGIWRDFLVVRYPRKGSTGYDVMRGQADPW